MNDNTAPVIAIIGHPNVGKSSVVATLSEDDSVPIGPTPGVTPDTRTYRVLIGDRPVLTFVDTPGFTNPTPVLEWFQKHQDLPNLPEAFVQAHSANREFQHDCSLLRPLADGAGVIFVVDASNEPGQHDKEEMEIIALTGLPRIAIKNPTDDDFIMEDWDLLLGRKFSTVRTFNAHRATFAERINLLRALSDVYREKHGTLTESIEVLEREWSRRMTDSATVTVNLLREALALKVEQAIVIGDRKGKGKREAIQLQLATKLKKELRTLEARAQGEMRKLFKHTKESAWRPPEHDLLEKDLFSDEVAKALGLGLKKAAVQGALAGGAAGAGADLALAQITFGMFMIAGGAAGGIGQVIRQVRKKPIQVAQALQGAEGYTMGPVKNPQFPFVLLDRMIIYSVLAMNWAHGRKGADTASSRESLERTFGEKQGYTDSLGRADLKVLGKFFADCRKGKKVSRHEDAAREVIARMLTERSQDPG